MKYRIEYTIKKTGEIVKQLTVYDTKEIAEYNKREFEMWDTRGYLDFRVIEIIE